MNTWVFFILCIMKKCSKCDIEKELSLFYSSSNKCIECYKKYVSEYKLKNLDKIKERNKEWSKQHYIKNKDKIVKRVKDYQIKNKDKIKGKPQKKRYYYKGKSRSKEEHLKIVEIYSLIRKEKTRIRRSDELDYKLEIKAKRKLEAKHKRRKCIKAKIRKIISRSIKNKGYTKNSRTFDILGCDYDTFIKHIERQFKEGMNWENHGAYGWHYDHILPLAYADSEEDIIRLNHYTNIRPLWATENIVKSDRIIEHQTTLPI